ncbi:Hypothetical protein PHPALM_19712 [Phytophthora palmivora]|uniref:Uncharacterized protein n=1 Tax=Phytophthora palmivora TaxID=4796 RepID=A0A2P4XGS1_9STRA|nr:Hypothetical protein PHPALM_19712 [Phytophthora palmivora]
METLQSVVKLPSAKDMESQLLAVLIRVVERREQWLVEQGVSVDSGKVPVEQGVQAILEELEKEHSTSVTEKRLKAVWHESEQEAVDESVALIHQGIDVKSPDEDAALRYAAKYDLINVVSLLLERSADVDTHDEDGMTALHYAVRGGHTGAVSLLLQHGADVAAIEKDGMTALHCASVNGHKEVVSMLLQHGADVAASDNDGLTVLHHAVTTGSTKMVSLLLGNGADAHAFTKEGHNALSHMILVKHDNPDDDYLAVVRLLCSQKQKIKLPSSTQTPPLEKHQLGMVACAQYWQDRHEYNEPLLKVPSEVVKNGDDAVKSYLADLEKMDASQKICVVGPSTWGKTSLIRSMAEGVPVDISLADRMTGIDLFSLRFLVVENETEKRHHDVTFWDFAGNDVYHLAHAVFISKCTLYLVCIDLHAYDNMLKEADAKVNSEKSMLEPERIKQRFFEEQILRWMVLILLRQPDAQFKLIGTKRDLVSDDISRIAVVKDVKRRLNIFLDGRDATGKMSADVVSSLRKEFNLADQDSTGNITPDAFNFLRKELSQELVTAGRGNVESAKEAIKGAVINNRGLSFKMPATYTKVLEHIKYLRRGAATRTQQTQMREVLMPVNKLCYDLEKILGLQNADCREILRVLHNLGDILWYEGRGTNLDELVILDPSVMLDLVREVVNHEYENKADERYKALWCDGTLPHSLLVTFPKWKCLDSLQKNGELVRRFKRLLHHLNLVYPANDMDSIDEADIIVPMYWKTREKAKKAFKPFTKQNTILEQNFGGNSYIAKWRYSLPIAISEAVFVNFVVKCYRPYIHREVRDTHFESSVRDEFHAAIYLTANETGHYDDIMIEVAAATKKLAWAEMMYFVIDMESILEKDYPGLTKLAKLKRCIIDDEQNAREVNYLLEGSSVGEARLRQTITPWLPPDFDWFIQRAWANPDVFDKIHVRHQLEVLKKLVVTKDKRRLPALWSLTYPKEGGPVEIRIHSDFSGKCWHEPLKIQITDNFFTNHSQFVQVGISVLSVVSGTIPIPVASAAAAQILAETKSTLTQATTVKTIIDQAHLRPGEKKSSNELDTWPTKRTKFLLALLAQHEPPLDERIIGDVCKLCRVATEDGQYIWVNQEELDQLKKHIKCEQEPYVPINPTTISLSITGTTGSWDVKVLTKVYCEWKLSHGIKDPDDFNGATKKAASTSTGATWESNVKILKVTSIKELRDCTLQVWVKQTRRLTGCFRNDKVIAKGTKKLDAVDENCSKTQTIDVPIDVGEATSPRRTVNCQITIEF